MFNVFPKITRLPEIPIKTYSAQFQLDRLIPGVDNIRYDVFLSPVFSKSINAVVRKLFLKHTKVGKFLEIEKTSSLVLEKDKFKGLCRDILHVGVNKAKSDSEIQIDLLVQIAIVKKLTEEIQSQYKTLIEDLNNLARKYEISTRNGLDVYLKIKDSLAKIQQDNQSILLNVGKELFLYFIEVQKEEIKEFREAVLGPETNLPDDIFANPILHVENPFDDYFMIDEYILLGHRFEDPDSYENFLFLIRSILRKILLNIFLSNFPAAVTSKQKETIAEHPNEKIEKSDPDACYEEVDMWLKHVDNINILFNSFKSKEHYKTLKKRKGTKEEIENFKNLLKMQEKLLNFIYKKFDRAGLMKRITACYEMKSVYLEYCPPLAPQQVLQFLIEPKQRKSITNQLDRLKGFYGKSFSLVPLKKKIKDLKTITTRDKKKYLIQFLNGFVRYHRDFQNFLMLRKAMDRIRLVSEEKTVDLSRENRILYEFLLPHEKSSDVKPIIDHVVIKADMRDSTHIILQMKKKGLNPASFFNLNFFVPITGILFEYAAEKVFIEGDAVILSISEYEDTPEGWYCVARACGLAIRIIQIVQQYNTTSTKYKLPILELGIGISYIDSAPTFLFDESNRIMISPAINSADRMSKSSKTLHKIIRDRRKPFNLYVFQKTFEGESVVPEDERLLRYNINGIELNTDGFEKLSKEIDLESLEIYLPELQKEKIIAHTGKFPTATGKYQRLVIREARMSEVDSENFKTIRMTDKKYYEICTHPMLYAYIENL